MGIIYVAIFFTVVFIFIVVNYCCFNPRFTFCAWDTFTSKRKWKLQWGSSSSQRTRTCSNLWFTFCAWDTSTSRRKWKLHWGSSSSQRSRNGISTGIKELEERSLQPEYSLDLAPSVSVSAAVFSSLPQMFLGSEMIQPRKSFESFLCPDKQGTSEEGWRI